MRTSPKIIICGHGNMAQTLERTCNTRGVINTTFEPAWADKEPGKEFPTNSDPDYANTVGVHFGSGKELLAFIRYCTARKIPIIQGSTRLGDDFGQDIKFPAEFEIVMVNAPNLALPVVRFMAAFPTFAEYVRKGMRCVLRESHQETKVDTSGTARKLAPALGLEEEDIICVRKRDEQQAMGIRQQHLGGHAIHEISMEGMGVRFDFNIEIFGRDCYAEGAIVFAQILLNVLKAHSDPSTSALMLGTGFQDITTVLSLSDSLEA